MHQMSTVEQKYDALLKEHISLEVKYDLMDQRLKRCEETVKQLQEMVTNQQKEIITLREQVNNLMGLGKKKK